MKGKSMFQALGVVLVTSTTAMADRPGATFTFDENKTGRLPEPWSIRQTRPTKRLATWQVIADPTAPSQTNVMALTRTDNYNGTFNLAVAKNTSFKDLDLTVKVKAVRGEEDQGGGPIWRCKDENNYYICRFNPLEANYRVYKVVDGRRKQLESARIKTEAGTWYTVRVTMVGDQITCYLDGKKMLQAEDGTFKEAGMLGLWSKADAVTSFDDLIVRSTSVNAGERAAAQTGVRIDADRISRAAGAKATVTQDGVVRITWPRTDVALKVDGMPFKPAAGLTSWAAFTPCPGGAMMMGDTVVFQDEVTPAMDAAFTAGLQVSALHNHFFYDEPKVYFMHIGGVGYPEELAAGVKSVWDAIKKVRVPHPQPATRFEGPVPTAGAIHAGVIEQVLNRKSTTKDGVVKVTIGRDGTMGNQTISASMGLTTWAAFSGADKLAAVDGDFIMTAEEVQPVLRALRKANIHIVALHNHMIGEEPTFYFTHFWGKGTVKDLAKGIKSALDAQQRAAKFGASP